MQNNALKTLLHPFDSGLLAAPDQGGRTLFLNAPADFLRPSDWAGAVDCIQDLRPDFLALQRMGLSAFAQAEGTAYDVALVLLGRHRGQNELWIADALERLRPGALLVVAGGKTDGAASLKKRLGALSEIAGHASKHHGIVFWLERPAEPQAVVTVLREENPATEVEGFLTAPGLFSHERIDAGSQFLAESLPEALKGRAADFGAGWGFLSVALARRAPAITSIDLFEASFAACDAARRNMEALCPGLPCVVTWRDLLSEPLPRQYDVIVMNPPFHLGRAAEPSIGEGMIRAASAALKPGGRLWLVANRGLPYEPTLAKGFARHGEAARDTRYKVLWAVR